MHAQNLLASVPADLQDCFDLVLVLFVFVFFFGSIKISRISEKYPGRTEAPKLKASLQETVRKWGAEGQLETE